MSKIHELSENLSNQIAAGEVIERPASVVKELVENAIDAGADRIRVDFTDAGLRQIVVQDNGSGIARDEIDLAFTRHATSKIQTERDLFNVGTLGFRGEALASIAAVARVEILTAVKGQVGVVADFSGGVKKRQEDAAAKEGTQITVSDLFYNTPARLKYLKSPRTETMRIVDIINRIALGHAEISFILANNGKVLLHTPGNGKLKQTVANIYGRKLAEGMLEFAASDPDFAISGLTTKPEVTRSSRNFISLLLNGRYIRNNQLNNAIMDAYGAKLAAKHYPVTILKIETDPLLVDVNVHPTKQEVRLSKEKELSRLITSTLGACLLKASQPASGLGNLVEAKTPDLQDQLAFNLNEQVVDTKRPIPKPLIEEPKPDQAEQNYVSMNQVLNNDRYVLTASWDENVLKQQQLAPFSNKQAKTDLLGQGERNLHQQLPELTYAGQTDKLLLAMHGHDLYLIDIAAALRAKRYEEIYQEIADHQSAQQVLLTPLVLEFNNLDYLALKDQLAEIAKLGIMLENFGQDAFIVRSRPSFIHGDLETSLRSLLDIFINQGHDATKLIARLAADEAGRMKVSSQLSPAECRKLLLDLAALSDPYHDPKGNLVIVRLREADLRKMFKRN
ncbi:DNA mismatch repair endonuclease MutL [Lactobacillus corticis]|uniref:DNA mismatch repair protein MutL n=1 Tax=Lactobacillus corticis TaxID=2201249 RepID=A0A916VHQ3_9LACO|nr:DNA mismatch repair endonuclease MutL [Lactobacillus corticis]GFZ27316.1 DNA mismatch repair protein MutL [Lactobacillus corticis]